jgi:hypothetical protein
MKKIEVKKIFLGKYVSVRDYLVDELIGKGEDLLITHEGESMLIKNKDLNKGIRDAKQQFSKFDKKSYHLVDFVWNPKKKEINENQSELF